MKVIGELSLSRCRCKQASFNIDHAMKTRKEEYRKEKYFKKIKESEPTDNQKFARAHSSLLASVLETEKAFQALTEELESFDKQRIAELRAVLLSFTKSELNYHSHALELYSKGYNMLRDVGMIYYIFTCFKYTCCFTRNKYLQSSKSCFLKFFDITTR